MSQDERYGAQVAWTPAAAPQRIVLNGRYVRVEPLNAALHGADLYRAAHGPGADPDLWTYLANGPYENEGAFLDDLARWETSTDPLFFAIVDPASNQARGVASLMRIDAANGVGEVGHIWFGPALQRTTAATEAIFLTADYVLTTLGYRRFEWKCNDLNTRSRRAAERYGFTYEGTFRQHLVVKGRNRDTAWYAIIDRDWPAIRAGFMAWLDPANFDDSDHQIRSLEECRCAPHTS
jgi:RimJ/RimL family protein N-acetyltransferase